MILLFTLVCTILHSPSRRARRLAQRRPTLQRRRPLQLGRYRTTSQPTRRRRGHTLSADPNRHRHTSRLVASLHLHRRIEHVVSLRRSFARPCTSTLFAQHPVHLFSQRIPRPHRPEPPTEPTESVEATSVPSFNTPESESDRSMLAARRRAQNESMRSRCFRGVVWHRKKLGRVVRMHRVGRRGLERVCVHEGRKWDRCNGQKRAPVRAWLGHGETRLGKGEQLVSDGCDDARRRSFLWAHAHVDMLTSVARPLTFYTCHRGLTRLTQIT